MDGLLSNTQLSETGTDCLRGSNWAGIESFGSSGVTPPLMGSQLAIMVAVNARAVNRKNNFFMFLV
jgi:hypothetical protein